MDTRFDCPNEDDGNLKYITNVGLIELLKNHMKCEISNTYVTPSLIDDNFCHCPVKNSFWCESELKNSSLCNNELDSTDWCEDEREYFFFTKKNILFQSVCDGFVEVIPKRIEGKIETDETECEQWSCNNIYTYCDGIWNCPRGEDEIGCYSFSKLNCSLDHHLCVLPNRNRLVCLSIEKINDDVIDTENNHVFLNKTNTVLSKLTILETPQKHQHKCHRGLDLRVWLNDEKNLTTKNTCLCPPSYYGNQCQYENQQVSLTIKFQALSDSWSTLFAIIISLIDGSEERIIRSYEQFTYLSSRDCKIKFNIYLLYLTRPKDLTQNYQIHIDIYEKMSLIYRGSLLYPIKFSFLPVQRLAYIAIIPRHNEKLQSCSNSHCIHGKCIAYYNNPQNNTFCQCYPGWSGRYCAIPYTCTCSSDSICIGVSAYNRSICICPINKFGYQCLIAKTICQMNNNLTCQHGGQCIPADEYMSTSNKKFSCICPKGYSGDRCEIVDNKIILTFEDYMVLSQSIFIHFIAMTSILTGIARRRN
ncbi:unnamed protein product [Rotaria sordida]|uniref:EGF-like domain-containing protein n=1 Tax=Rotaria sordida TaxID=392033 RepID=A0A819N0Z0_9BILA|nr:unnamed protein product [Rotaria sordida]